MLEPGRFELCGHVGGPTPIVAEHETSVDRPLQRGQGVRTAQHDTAYGVDGHRPPDRIVLVDDRVRAQPCPDMSRSTPVGMGQFLDPPTDSDPIARRPSRQTRALRSRCLEFHAAAVGVDIDDGPSRQPLWVRHEGHGPSERAIGKGRETGERLRREGRCREEPGDHDQPGPTKHQCGAEHDDRRPDRQWHRSEDSHPDRDREHVGEDPPDRSGIHPTVTNSRNASSLAAPMPRTDKRSSTDRNGPFC
jgi:hypothetical protein